MILSDIAEYVTEKVNSDKITLNQYVTTDSLLQNKRGRQTAQNLPPMPCVLTSYSQGDILISNIRPYLKKIWFADSNGGCSTDVLVFRAKKGHSSNFLFALLMQDAFFSYMMQGSKGSKMPRGDKNQIMHYKVPTFSSFEEENIGNIIVNIERKIALNRQINDNLEAMARQLYDYWFVQFDFPDENGRPYKSSGGKMIYNEDLQLHIPEKWCICELKDYIISNNTGDWGYDTMSAEHPISVTCIRGADILKLINLPHRYIKTKNVSKLLHPWNVVIEVSGGSPTQSTGRCALITPGVLRRNGDKVTCSNFCHAFTLQEDICSAYFYYTWKALYDNNNMFNYEGKTSGIKNFMTNMFLANKWVVVPHDIMKSFFEKVKSIYTEIDNNIDEINSLSKQRDELLPLLMNGQATVNSD